MLTPEIAVENFISKLILKKRMKTHSSLPVYSRGSDWRKSKALIKKRSAKLTKEE